MGIFITNEAVKENQKRKRNPKNKYIYEIDVSSSVKIVRKFFGGTLHDIQSTS